MPRGQGQHASLLSELREMVDDQHRRAMRALDEIGSYLSGDASGGSTEITQLLAQFNNVRSKRRVVLETITDNWKTVPEIARETGLNEQSVRGVLYAKGPHARIVQRNTEEELIRFRLDPTQTARFHWS